MAAHHLHLHPEPFELIRLGQKTIESRLLDKKRQSYSVDDILIFTNRANEGESIQAKITRLHKSTSFRDLFLSTDTRGKFSVAPLKEFLDGIEIYYSKEDQEKYGVVGIEFIVEDIK